MPFYLKKKELLPIVKNHKSVLIVPCHFCPAASLSITENKPYIALFSHLMKTEAYVSYIKQQKKIFIENGFKAEVFDSKLLHQFVACLWVPKRRQKLAEKAKKFDAVVVLGCDSMIDVVRQALGDDMDKVLIGMESLGLMNALPSLHFPFNITLKMNGITPVVPKTSDKPK